MKKLFRRIIKPLLLLTLVSVSCSVSEAGLNTSILREGDIIFQSSQSSQSDAVKAATGSDFSHMGIIFRSGKRFMVLEAVNPVSVTPLERFISRSEGRFAIKRLRDREKILTAVAVKKMKAAADAYIGKRYDIYFRWDDRRIYCSELVWKIYKKGAGIEIGRLQRARELNLGDPAVQKLLKRRYGKAVPLDEIIITPQSMYESGKLFTVYERR
ncbi:MAG TPA: YiiX family permuted papain-like enzyme [Spirochaetota bacterium]|nr:YiiX family permuted papain-like enzyme [Spirochaetota bacterium]